MTDDKKHILIVEDDTDLATVLSDKLAAAGFTTTRAENGRVGLETALKDHPDLILLDIMMPVMDGIEMLTELRKDEWGGKARVAMLTNVEDVQSVSEALGNESFDYIVKSDWDLDSVVAKVEDMLRY